RSSARPAPPPPSSAAEPSRASLGARDDAQDVPAPEVHLSGGSAAAFADVTHATHVDVHTASVARLRVPGGERGGAYEHVPRHCGIILGNAHDDVTAGRAAAHVQPVVLWRGDLEREGVVLLVAA